MKELYWWILLSNLIFQKASSSPQNATDVVQSSSTNGTRIITAADLVDKGEYFNPTNGFQSVGPLPIPEEFEIETRPKPGGLALHRLSYYTAVAQDLAAAAFRPWNQEVNLYHFTPTAGIGFDFKSGKNPPFYETRLVMWTFLAVYLDMNTEGFWQELSWITRLAPQVVGVGKVFVDVSDGIAAKDSADNFTESDSSRNMSASNTSDRGPALPTLRYVSPSTAVSSRGLSLNVAYVINGHSFPFAEVYTSAFWLIITAAPFNPDDPALSMGRYDQQGNVTLVVLPLYETGEFKWWMAIDSLWMILDFMKDETPGGRWAEARARVRVNGVNVGRLYLVKGRVTPSELESAFDDLENEEFDVNTTGTGNITSATTTSPSKLQTYATS